MQAHHVFRPEQAPYRSCQLSAQQRYACTTRHLDRVYVEREGSTNNSRQECTLEKEQQAGLGLWAGSTARNAPPLQLCYCLTASSHLALDLTLASPSKPSLTPCCPFPPSSHLSYPHSPAQMAWPAPTGEARSPAAAPPAAPVGPPARHSGQPGHAFSQKGAAG